MASTQTPFRPTRVARARSTDPRFRANLPVESFHRTLERVDTHTYSGGYKWVWVKVDTLNLHSVAPTLTPVLR